MKKVILSMLAVSAIVFTSCKKDEVNKKEPAQQVAPNSPYKAVEVKAYASADDKTVSYGGQTARLAMASELKSDLGSAESTKEVLEAKFMTGTGFSDAVQVLNTSNKNINGSIAYSLKADATEKGHYVSLVKNTIGTFTAIDKSATAKEGTAGKLDKSYFDANGVEQNQIFAKVLIGSMCLDMTINKYLSDAKIGAAVSNTPKDGKAYGSREHHWDEAYGYVFGKVQGKRVLLGKYLTSINKLKSFANISQNIENAFADGRAAIKAGEDATVTAKAKFIKENLSKVVAVKAISYLMKGKGVKNRGTLHALSEGLGFIHSLRFAHFKGTQVTKDQVDSVLAILGDNMWSVSDDKLEEAAKKISDISGVSILAATTLK